MDSEDRTDNPAGPRDQTLTVLCPECGDLIEIKNPRSFVLSLHQKNVCTLRALMGESVE